jgi:hypothetical protein
LKLEIDRERCRGLFQTRERETKRRDQSERGTK